MGTGVHCPRLLFGSNPIRVAHCDGDLLAGFRQAFVECVSDETHLVTEISWLPAKQYDIGWQVSEIHRVNFRSHDHENVGRNRLLELRRRDTGLTFYRAGRLCGKIILTLKAFGLG